MIYLLSIAVFAVLLGVMAGLLIVAERFLLNYGICEISVNAGEEVLEVEGGQSLLDALNANEIYIPSACGGQGTCGYCKVTVLGGGGEVLPTELPMLDRTERRSGVRLACQVKVREAMEIRIPEDILNVQLFQARVEHTRQLTPDIKEIRLALEEPAEITQRPGQYVQIQAPSPEGPVWRAYSISSPVSETRAVELVVRLVPGGFGSTYLHNLQVGDPVTFTGPFGEFELEEDPETDIVCVAGGCGMAPVKDIVETVAERWPGRETWLFFGCRTGEDAFYRERFKALQEQFPGLHVVYALSEPGPEDADWDGETGFIHLSVDKHLDRGGQRQAFLCGPPPMIEAVTRVLHGKGLADKDIFYDEF